MKTEKLLSVIFVVCAAAVISDLMTELIAYEPGGRKDFSLIDVRTHAYPAPGKILVSTEIIGTPHEATYRTFKLTANIISENSKADNILTEHFTGPGMREEMVLDARKLAAGDYSVRIEFSDPGGELLHSESHGIKWPGRCEKFEGIEILNNFVWELLSEEPVAGGKISGEYGFNLPYDRWLFVRSSAPEFEEGRISVVLRAGGDDEEIIAHVPGGPERLEAMRKVRKGRHSVEVRSEGGVSPDKLEVRAVPEIQHHRYPSAQHGKTGVSYNDWEWLEQYILPNVNTIQTSFPYRIEREVKLWRQKGGRWIARSTRPALRGELEVEKCPESIYEYFKYNAPGYTHPYMDGVYLSEFSVHELPYAPGDNAINYIEAVKKLNEDPELKGKSFNPTAGKKFGLCEYSSKLARVCIESGGSIFKQIYIHARESLPDALNAKRRSIYSYIEPREKVIPGTVRNTVWMFGSFSYPWPIADGYAHVNYNAFLDMQFRMIANHPALFGLGGVTTWRTGYQDEELTRLFSRMFRHYCIEGETERYTDYPYMLEHIENPDFFDGLQGWDIEGSVKAGAKEGFGRRNFLNRYYEGPDTFIVIEGPEENPSLVRQKITGLEEGKLYSAKLISGDYEALLKGISREKEHPVSLKIRGSAMLAGPRYCYRHPFPSSGEALGFTEENPFWFNYHWQVFRAESTQAELKIKFDPAGEQTNSNTRRILCTYAEIKPYMDKK